MTLEEFNRRNGISVAGKSEHQYVVNLDHMATAELKVAKDHPCLADAVKDMAKALYRAETAGSNPGYASRMRFRAELRFASIPSHLQW